MNPMNSYQAYEFVLLALCIWREARGEVVPAKFAVAWSIRNRVAGPSWWGKDWISVILKPLQYSSFNAGDPNSTKWPAPADTSWQASLMAAEAAYQGTGTDPICGATHYYDRSMDANPPEWAKDKSMVHVANVGNLRFWKRA